MLSTIVALQAKATACTPSVALLKAADSLMSQAVVFFVQAKNSLSSVGLPGVSGVQDAASKAQTAGSAVSGRLRP